jgi:hypothetical protein
MWYYSFHLGFNTNFNVFFNNTYFSKIRTYYSIENPFYSIHLEKYVFLPSLIVTCSTDIVFFPFLACPMVATIIILTGLL